MNNYFHSDDDVGIFSDITINSEYYNCITLADKISTRKCPLLISLNIQSLQSKFSNLLQFINELNSVKLNVDVIALQETWKVPHVDQFTIPGFHPLVYADRKGSRGGGVGFYIKSSLKFTILNNFPSLPKVFENIVIDIQYPNQHLLLSCIYRSPNPNQGVTITDHIDEFIAKLDDHLTKINERKANSYIFLDANINLSLLNSNKNSKEYLNTIVSNGFLPTITKATRIQNESATFIDQILTNVTDNIQNFGTLVTDVSDHFCNFVFIPHKNHINTGINKRRREFNEANCNRFKQQLGGVDWSSVTNCMNVNLSFDEFWKIFSALYA
jgi:exonuclease III